MQTKIICGIEFTRHECNNYWTGRMKIEGSWLRDEKLVVIKVTRRPSWENQEVLYDCHAYTYLKNGLMVLGSSKEDDEGLAVREAIAELKKNLKAQVV